MAVVEHERLAIPTKTKRAAIFQRAADLIEEFGWKQGDYGSKEQAGFCMIGALAEARVDLGDIGRDSRVPKCYIGVTEDWLGNDWNYQWNDEDGRTKDEVVARLRVEAERA